MTKTIKKKVSSTNDLARQLAKKGAKEGDCVVSESQTAGRGRLQRKWLSKPGNLYLSLILRPKILASCLSQLTFVSALAVSKTLEKYINQKPQLKWPNDVLVDGKKISGILLESETENERVEFVIVGVGINVNQKQFPQYIENATSLYQILHKEMNVDDVLNDFLKSFEEWYLLFQKEGFSFIKEMWEKQHFLKGRMVEIKDGKKKVKGTVMGLNDQGALIIKNANEDVLPIYSGDLLWS